MQVYNDECLYHFGKKGMKWGKRTVSNIKEGISVRNQTNKDMLIHPIHSTKAQLNMVRKSPLKALGSGTEAFKELNADVKKRVGASKKPKTKKQITEHRAAGAKTVGNILKFAGANVIAANRNNQAMKVSKMIFPD